MAKPRDSSSLIRRAVLVPIVTCIAATTIAAGQAPPRADDQTPAVMTPADFQSLPSQPPDHRLAYGDDANQFGELRLPPASGPQPVVVLIHGGCWKAEYATLRDLGPMGDALEAANIASWNVEYRRIRQPGSGWPGTYLDVGRAIDHLRQVAPKYGLDASRIVVLGHSAGGHLAMWAAARHRLPPTSEVYLPNPLPIRGVINLAGTIDMRENIARMEAECHDSVVTAMLGGPPASLQERYRQVSVTTMVPLAVSQVLIWGEHENFVPESLARRHVDAARSAGDSARLIVIPRIGHFESASPRSAAWPIVLGEIRSLLGLSTK